MSSSPCLMTIPTSFAPARLDHYLSTSLIWMTLSPLFAARTSSSRALSRKPWAKVRSFLCASTPPSRRVASELARPPISPAGRTLRGGSPWRPRACARSWWRARRCRSRRARPCAASSTPSPPTPSRSSASRPSTAAAPPSSCSRARSACCWAGATPRRARSPATLWCGCWGRGSRRRRSCAATCGRPSSPSSRRTRSSRSGSRR
mmetsp:Transcript_20081/g.42106  ORF Transcript_20081/g.42106 Transcript_20081/m.42106 type:complete len:205 (+) Transcript_20081:226-840(+)